VLGPLAGAIAAARVGFRGSFVVGAGILWACAALVRWGAPSLPAPSPIPRHDHRAPTRQVLAVCALVLGGSVQVLFLASILPQVLPDLGVGPGDTLLVGGVVIFASGLAAAAGSLLAPPLARALGERAAIVGMLAASSALLVCLAPLRSVWGFVALRFLQVLCVAPIFPIAVTGIAQQARGEAIGMVNGARIAAAFVGPVLSTSVLVWSSPGVLYVGLAALGLACVPLVRYGRVAGREALA
jgi:MFS family permease